jgi:cytochrome c peroxidase
LARAIASYERTQFSFDSPFDHFMAGDANPIADSARRGWKLFNSKECCNKCHALSEDKQDPTYLMDKDFHNIGIAIVRHNVVAEACKAEQQIDSGNLIDVDRAAVQSDMSVLGRFLVTKKEADIASFKTPGLRNVLVTAQYFHDGSQATLWDVLDHYNKGDGTRDPWLDQDIEPLALSEAEMDEVVAFLASLTSSQYKEQGIREFGSRTRTLPHRPAGARHSAHLWAPAGRAKAVAQLCGFASRDKFKVTFPVTQTKKDV